MGDLMTVSPMPSQSTHATIDRSRLSWRTELTDPRDRLIVALDVDTREQAEGLVAELGEAIRQRGGVAEIERCQHFTWAKSDRFRAWEGHGLGSRFLRNLAAAYAVWVAEQSVATDA